jgi:Flp pilus assembly pilin Flp
MRHRLLGYCVIARSQLRELFIPGSARNRNGQELVEYALMVGFIAVSVAATVPYQVTTPVSAIFSKIKGYLVLHGG